MLPGKGKLAAIVEENYKGNSNHIKIIVLIGEESTD